VALQAIDHGDGWLVVGSNWARPHHPAWSNNLLATTRATVATRSTEIEVSVHPLDGDERRRAWATILDALLLRLDRAGRIWLDIGKVAGIASIGFGVLAFWVALPPLVTRSVAVPPSQAPPPHIRQLRHDPRPGRTADRGCGSACPRRR
jgi:hypothetical protein